MSDGRVGRIGARVLGAIVPTGRLAASGSVYRRAVSCARSELGDEVAVERLRTETARNRKAGIAALRSLEGDRKQFDIDRAYRLLEAAVCGTPVRPAPVEHGELFAREENLGRLPLTEAIETLVGLEPRLADVLAHGPEQSKAPMLRVNELVGPNSQHRDSLVRSQLALSIAAHTLATGPDATGRDGDGASYFSAERKRVVRA